MSSFKSKLAFFQNAALQQQAYQQQAHQQPVHQQPAHQQQSFLQPIHQQQTHQQQTVHQQPANHQQSYLQPIHQPQQVNQPPSYQQSIRQPQQINQPPSYQQPVHQPQYSINRQSQNPTFAQKVNPTPTIQNSNEASIHPSSSKASTASQKPIISNSNFKSKLAFYNQQSTPLVPLHPHPSGNAERKAQPTFSDTNSRITPSQSVINENNPENTSSLPISAVKNDNIQPKVQPQRQPPKSFKDKIAMISTIQQPMGIYDYKKKQNANQARASEPMQTFPETPVQVFPDQILKKPKELPPEPHLPSLTAGRARRQARRPPSLEQSNNKPSELPPTSPI